MAPKDTAAAANDVRDGVIAGRTERDGTQYPSLRIQGEAPRKGSRLRVRLDNGVVYTAKVVSATVEHLIETDGLEPEREDAPEPGSDIVPG